MQKKHYHHPLTMMLSNNSTWLPFQVGRLVGQSVVADDADKISAMKCKFIHLICRNYVFAWISINIADSLLLYTISLFVYSTGKLILKPDVAAHCLPALRGSEIVAGRCISQMMMIPWYSTQAVERCGHCGGCRIISQTQVLWLGQTNAKCFELSESGYFYWAVVDGGTGTCLTRW